MAAASLLVAVLRVAVDKAAEAVEDLLVEPLLLNYGGDIRNFLNGIDAADPASSRVKSAISRNEAYLEALRNILELKEMQPSEHERQIERSRVSDEMRKAFKQAESGSVFLNLVKRSVILYGHRSISYLSGPDSSRRPVEMDLHSHGVSIEFPRMEVADPVGLNYMIRAFRAERMVS